MRVIVETDRDVEPEQFAAELARRTNSAPPVISTRPPGQPDGDGGTLPGLVVVDGEYAEDVVAQVLATHQPHENAQADRLANVRSAATVAQLRDALVAYLEAG